MKLLTVAKLAMAGAVMLGFAITGGPAYAQCATGTATTADAQDPFTLNICATVQNTFNITVDDVSFGNIGATGWVGQSGCLIMNTDGTFDESNSACIGSYGAAPTIARIVSADDAPGTAIPGTPGSIDIAGAFVNQEIRMWFQVQETSNDMPPSLGVGPSLYFTSLEATTAAGVGTNTQDGLWIIDAADAPEAPGLPAADTAAQAATATAAGAEYQGLTDNATGNLEILIGATIQTDGTFAYATDGSGSRYASDDYEGTFEVVLFY